MLINLIASYNFFVRALCIFFTKTDTFLMAILESESKDMDL